jgi:hypothetical protein
MANNIRDDRIKIGYKIKIGEITYKVRDIIDDNDKAMAREKLRYSQANEKEKSDYNPANYLTYTDPNDSQIVYILERFHDEVKGGAKKKHLYNGRSYTIRYGERGGKYILVSKKKVYI